MKLVSTFHPSSSVASSVKCRLTPRDVEHLVVAKTSRIDVHALRPHGLEHLCGLDMWGTICAVRAIPISSESKRSNLVVMSNQPEPKLAFLSLQSDENGSSLQVAKYIMLHERGPKTAEFLSDIIVHEDGHLAVVSCYGGKLKIVELEGGRYKRDFDVSIPEVNLFSFAFLPADSETGDECLALLYLDSEERLQLCARKIDLSKSDLVQSNVLGATAISTKMVSRPEDCLPKLVPVPPQDSGDEPSLGGVLVVGGLQIIFFEVLSKDGQNKLDGKQRRLQNRLSSGKAEVAAAARLKNKERESRKRKPSAIVDWPWSKVGAWCAVEGSPYRFFLGDEYGRLAMLSSENFKQLGLILITLGETSPPQSLTYLTNQLLFVGSHGGDSQLIQISPTPLSDLPSMLFTLPSGIKPIQPGRLAESRSRSHKGKDKVLDSMDMDDEPASDDTQGMVVTPGASYIAVVETFKSLAPIKDGILVDIEKSGENQIVLCTGMGNSGALRVARRGANFQELAFVQGLTGIANIFSAKSSINDSHHTHFVVSAASNTLLYRIDDRGQETTLTNINTSHLGDLVTTQPTLAFSNLFRRNGSQYLDSSLVVQVVPKGVILLEWDPVFQSYQQRAIWKPVPIKERKDILPEITAAACNSSQIAVAVAGGKVHLFILGESDNHPTLEEWNSFKSPSGGEVSAISCTPLDPSKPHTTLIFVAYWKTNRIEVLALDRTRALTLEATSSGLPGVVRSLLPYNFGRDGPKGPDYHPYLLAGLGDGHVAAMQLRGKQLGEVKLISLGAAPVSLTPCAVEGRKAVFAAGSRSAVLYLDKKRLANAAVMLKEALAVTCFNSPSFNSTLAIATPKGLFIGRVEELNEMNIRTVPFGIDNPVKVVHEPLLKVFGVACVQTVPERVGADQKFLASFRIIDDTTMALLGQYNTPINEDMTSAVAFSAPVNGQERPFFCVGSYDYVASEAQPSVGRIALLTAYTGGRPQGKTHSVEVIVLHQIKVPGCVYALKYVDGKIVAAVESSVHLYAVNIDTTSASTPTYTLQILKEWNHSYVVTSLGAFENHVVVGDQINSVALVKVQGEEIVTEAKEWSPLWPVSVEALGPDSLICCTDDLNLYLWKMASVMGRTVLEKTGRYHLGEMVSCFVRGSLSTDDSVNSGQMKPELVFFTSSGSIGVVVDVPDIGISTHLSGLERNLATVFRGVGGMNHSEHRTPRSRTGFADSDEKSFGVIDGDFIEQFTTIASDADLNKVLMGSSEAEALGLSRTDIFNLIEELQALH